MSVIICGWCGDRCHMSLFGKPKVSHIHDSSRYEYIADAAFACDGCGRLSVATWLSSEDPAETHWWDADDEVGPRKYEQVVWSPAVGHQKDFPDVPDEIASAAKEAWTCHVVGAQRGAVMLARAVVESTAKANGINEGSLAEKIREMASNGLIRAAVKEQADEIRHMGNGSAHGDLGDAVTSEDAEEVLELMGEILNEVFQAPARSRRLADARNARKTATS